LPQKEHPQKDQPPARPDARQRFLHSARGALRDKVRPENGSAHRPERMAVDAMAKLAARRGAEGLFS